jgi:hypothetical protein
MAKSSTTFDTDKFTARLRDLRKKNLNFDEIATTLASEGFKTPNGKKVRTQWLYANSAKYLGKRANGRKASAAKAKAANSYAGRVAQKTVSATEAANRATNVARYVTQMANDSALDAATKIEFIQRLTG